MRPALTAVQDLLRLPLPVEIRSELVAVQARLQRTVTLTRSRLGVGPGWH